MNMLVLRKTRKRPEPGDIFVYRMRGFDYGFGRVIRTDARMEPFEDLLLLYIYKAFSREPTPIPQLRKHELLCPPMLVWNHGSWTRGYFRTVAKVPLVEIDILDVHCFWSEVHECYLDEYENRLQCRHEPCGFRAVGDHSAIDVDISLALGIEPHPDTLSP